MDIATLVAGRYPNHVCMHTNTNVSECDWVAAVQFLTLPIPIPMNGTQGKLLF